MPVKRRNVENVVDSTAAIVSRYAELQNILRIQSSESSTEGMTRRCSRRRENTTPVLTRGGSLE